MKRRRQAALIWAVGAVIVMSVASLGVTDASGHSAHRHDDGRIPGEPDFRRIGEKVFEFHPRAEAYTYKRRPDATPQWYHFDDFAASPGGLIDLPDSKNAFLCASNGHRIRVIYSSTANPATPTTAEREAIIGIVERITTKVAEESLRSSGEGRVLKWPRVDCDSSGELQIRTLTAPGSSHTQIWAAADTAFGAPENANAVKNLIFFDGSHPEGVAGVGGIYYDTLKSSSDSSSGNYNRIKTTSAVVYHNGYPEDPFGYWDSHVGVHEMFHTLGAVQPGAPYSTTGFHCIDGIDVLCYKDGPGVEYSEFRCPENGFFETPAGVPLDCEYDTYFDSLEESGEWLKTHWNSGGAENPFLATPQYLLNDSQTGGPSDYALDLTSKLASDIPVAGDWNGDGVDSTGFYRPSTATWYLKNANFSGSVDIIVQYGSPYDRPVTGDWNEDGVDTIGVYRPSNGTFYLRNFNSGGSPQYAFAYGNNEDLPVAGDWDNSGTDTIGLYRPSNGVFYLSNVNATVPPAYSFAYGNSGNDDLPLAGDWDENGYDSVGVFRQSNGVWYLDNEVPGDQPISYVHSFGNLDHVSPIVGDWNASGTDTPGLAWK